MINEEPNKLSALKHLWGQAQKGQCEIWTSTYTYIEAIYKKEPPYGQPYNHADDDRFIFEALEQPFVKRVQVDVEVAKLARKLRRDVWDKLRLIKADSIHLATAIHHNATELHTWDGSHLLPLTNTLSCRNGGLLPIVKPGPGDDLPLMKMGEGNVA
jgi:predicted nucleic acid-binding protein